MSRRESAALELTKTTYDAGHADRVEPLQPKIEQPVLIHYRNRALPFILFEVIDVEAWEPSIVAANAEILNFDAARGRQAPTVQRTLKLSLLFWSPHANCRTDPAV